MNGGQRLLSFGGDPRVMMPDDCAAAYRLGYGRAGLRGASAALGERVPWE